MQARVREILSWYGSDSPGTRTNLARLLNHGRLAGTGRFVILPVDQGFEHGPARSFAVNPPAYDPLYHFRLAIDAGCNAYAAPLGFLEAGAAEFAGEIPLILKMNNHDVLNDEKDPLSAVTASVKDALRLGCVGVGFTIYPGSTQAQIMYAQCREMIQEAKAHGLVAVVWSYPRGSGLSKAGETAVDVIAYAAQIAAQLGAHLIKVKPPAEHIEQPEAKKAYEKAGVPIGTLAERVRHVVQSAFDGRRVVIFSGGATKENDEAIYEECRGIRDGGGFGSIIGRNSFQRPRDKALAFLATVMKIYSGEVK
ncbi:MAG: class I fructose-bisphosphate aldolase [Candidatus Rokubacteria bacterium]|nr:class I fructose-bisphosphate aldolase [Candidatus Rokubacteria bacterium]MBI2198713.1 class I fructose-bisphosphate aldolase [Candidatus Rokubacteria bacterium]MBI3103980.1 class I fructose-bisphosphate aldolase [Candidatus Rokubacteria bacterium]